MFWNKLLMTVMNPANKGWANGYSNSELILKNILWQLQLNEIATTITQQLYFKTAENASKNNSLLIILRSLSW